MKLKVIGTYNLFGTCYLILIKEDLLFIGRGGFNFFYFSPFNCFYTGRVFRLSDSQSVGPSVLLSCQHSNLFQGIICSSSRCCFLNSLLNHLMNLDIDIGSSSRCCILNSKHLMNLDLAVCLSACLLVCLHLFLSS